MVRSLLLALLGTCLSTAVVAQDLDDDERGFPFITNYEPGDYGGPPQIWCVLQGPRQMMLFCGSDGVYEFDGTDWRVIRTPHRTTIRSMAIDDEGIVYVGGVGDLGRLSTDEAGVTTFESLVDHLPDSLQEFTDVWETDTGEDGVYFRTTRHIMRWDGSDFAIWAAEQDFHVGGFAHGKLYIRQWGVGLMVLENDQLQLVPGGERFAQERIYVVHPWDDGKVLLGTRTQGLQLFDGSTFERFETEADDYLLRNQIYLPGLELSDGSLVLGTVYGGAVHIDRKGRLIQILNQDNGIINEAVYYMALDARGDIWLTTDAGISRVEVGSPFTVFDDRANLVSQPYNATRHDGRIFVGHQGGVYEMRNAEFHDLPGTSEQVFWTSVINDRLFVAGGQSGIYEVVDGRLVNRLSSNVRRLSTWTFQPWSKDDRYVFVGLSEGILVARRETSGRWTELSYMDLTGHANTFVEAEPGVLWIGSATSGVFRVTYSLKDGHPDLNDATVETFNEDDGVFESSSLAWEVADKTYFTTTKGVLTFDSETSTFRAAEGLGLREAEQPDNLPGQLYELESGEVWSTFGGRVAKGTPNEDGSYEWTYEPFGRLERLGIQSLFPENDGVAWFPSLAGLVRYEPSADPESAPVTALIRRVSTEGDSVLYGGGPIAPIERELPFSSNEVRFDYSTPSYIQTSRNRYRTKLEGFDDDWSDWSSESRRAYTNLPPGAYSFLVRARDVYGTESNVASYEFRILAPWYRTWWAYLAYVLLGGGLILGFVRLRTGQLQERQRELEQTVEERTAEIRQRVEELGVINSVQQGLVAEMDMKGIYDLVGDRIRDLFDAQVVVIRSYHLEENIMELHYAIEKGERINVPPLQMDGMQQELAGMREPILINRDFADFVRKHGGRPASAGEEPKSAIFVPLFVGDDVRGNISLQNVDHEDAFSESDVRLLTTLANSMSVALENARLFHETNRLLAESDQRASELATVNEISKALVSQLEFDTLVQLIGDQIRDLFKADIVYVAFLDKEREILNFPYGHGDDFPPLPYGTGLTSQIIQTGEPLLINEDVTGSYEKLGLEEVGKSSASYLGVPIRERGEVVGVVSVQSTQITGRFDEDDMRLLTTIAANVGIALQNAESYQELNKTLQDLKATQEQLVTQEKMASLGQLTAGIAHEIKNPLNFVNNFSELNSELAHDLVRELKESQGKSIDDVYDELFDIATSLKTNAAQINKHGRRADSIVKNMMQHASGTSTERFRVEVNAFVDEYIGLAYHGMRAQTPNLNVNIIKDFDERAGNAEMAPQELGRVLLNLVNNALYAVHERSLGVNGAYEPTVTVSTKRRGNQLEIEVVDNGTGIPEHVRERIFEPLFTTKPTGSGTGLGLSLAFDIVTQVHKGEIRVESEEGKGSRFVVRIPS